MLGVRLGNFTVALTWVKQHMVITKESNGTVTIDGSNTLLFTKNKAGFTFNGRASLNLTRWTVYGAAKGFINRIKQSYMLFKWLAD
jgi:filamentous hemagglutinin family protein